MKPMPKSDKLLDVVLNLTPEDIQKILSKLNTEEEKREFDFLISQYAKNTLRKIKQKFSIPKIYRDIFGDEAAKYIVLKGGRGSGKTFAIICYMLEQSFEEKYSDSLFLVLREIQTSIEDSVHSVVSDLIKQAGLEQYFKITHSKIINKLTNVEFAFTGLRSTGGKTAFSQVNKIKGKHKVRMVFMDEAQDASQDSLDVLFPTVNRSGNVSFTSEYERLLRLAFGAEEVDLTEARFFFAMNPNFAEDPVITKVRAFGDQAVIKHINIFDLLIAIKTPNYLNKQKGREARLLGHTFGLVSLHRKFPATHLQKRRWLQLKKTKSCCRVLPFWTLPTKAATLRLYPSFPRLADTYSRGDIAFHILGTQRLTKLPKKSICFRLLSFITRTTESGQHLRIISPFVALMPYHVQR
ncbi:TPA: phage terminase large subunit [Vibrio parahaemolyticus]|nr:phage terminase large subunit [Vibrio parahaemolyticus]